MRRKRCDDCHVALSLTAELPVCSLRCGECELGQCRIAGVSPRRRVLTVISPGGKVRVLSYREASKVVFQRSTAAEGCLSVYTKDGRELLALHVRNTPDPVAQDAWRRLNQCQPKSQRSLP